ESFSIKEELDSESNDNIENKEPINLSQHILEQQENSGIFENEENKKVSQTPVDKPIPKRRKNFKSDFTIDVNNKPLDKYTKETTIKFLLKKYGKSLDLFSKVDPNNELNTEELLEHRISCM